MHLTSELNLLCTQKWSSIKCLSNLKLIFPLILYDQNTENKLKGFKWKEIKFVDYLLETQFLPGC